MSLDQDSPRDGTTAAETSVEEVAVKDRADATRQRKEDPGGRAGHDSPDGPEGRDTHGRSALQKGYDEHLEKAQAEERHRREQQLKALEKQSRRYEKQARHGIDQAGIDVEAMRADFAAAADGGPDDALERFEAARHTWAPLVSKAATASGLDGRQATQELRAALGDDRPQEQTAAGSRLAERVPDADGLVGYSVNIDSWWTPPPPPPPPPAASTVVITKPYTLGSTKGDATADRNSGRLNSSNDTWVGSQQQLASVGGSFVADASVRRIRVETVVDASFYTLIGAIFGYASAEVIVNLKVLDGATLRGSQRLSLIRTVSAVYWIASDRGSGAYTLACEFTHAFGTPKTYAALVELETWAGGGGLAVVSPATASATATPRDITVTLIR